MARTAAGSRSGMDEYELHGHLNEKLFRAIGNCFENLSSSVGSISEEIYSRQAVYLSYTFLKIGQSSQIFVSKCAVVYRWKPHSACVSVVCAEGKVNILPLEADVGRKCPCPPTKTSTYQ